MENEKRPLTKFCTGSSYIGEWNQLRMSGKGEYTMSNGIVYRGGMNESQFHGYGMLTYPNGHQIRGHWLNGRVQDMKFIFNDGLVFTEDNWEYCNGTDRRFYFEINNGLPPIGRHNLTSQQRIINLSDGCYDTGGGIYILSKKILVNPETNEIIRIPTKSEEIWIMENCRMGGREKSIIPQMHETKNNFENGNIAN